MKLHRLFLGAMCATSLAACGNGGGGGTVSVALTAGPRIAMQRATGAGEVRSAVVTIDRIYLQGDADSSRVVLRDTPVTTDLTSLAADTQELVAGVPVPSGSYSQLRFVISGAYVETTDGSIYATPDYPTPPGSVVSGELRTPSWGQSGLKIDLPGGAVEVSGDQHILLVDFDVLQSFGPMTGSGAWIMHPVVSASEIGLSATLQVDVDARAVDGTLSASVALHDRGGNDAGTRPLVDDNGDGVYSATFTFLDPTNGPFSLQLMPADGLQLETDPALPLMVTLQSGATDTVQIAVTAVTAP